MAKQEKSAAELYREERKARIAKAAKKNAKKSISADSSAKIAKVITVLLVLALVGGIAGMVVNLTGVADRNKTAFYVGDIKVTQPEYSYYYNYAYNYTYEELGQYDSSSTGIDFHSSPDTQVYNGILGDIEGFPEGQTPMWTDFFAYTAKQRIKLVKACVKEAEQRGITIGDEERATVELAIDQIKETAKANNYSFAAYLRASFDNGMTESLYRKILEEEQLLALVGESKTDELANGYTEKQVAKEYKTNTADYAVVSFRGYVVQAETVEDKEAGTSSVTDETMAAAKKVADKLAADSTDEESFKKAVSELEKANDNVDYEKILTDDSLTLQSDVNYSTLSQMGFDEEVLEWLFSAKTGKNATRVVESADTGYTVYLMVDPAHKAPDSKIYDVRHILIKFPEDSSSTATEEPAEEPTEEATEAAQATTAEGETATEAAKAETTEAATEKETTTAAPEVKVETLDVSKYSDVTVDLAVNGDTATDKETYKKAQDILKEYLDGDKTAASFAKLAKEYTADSNGSQGGLYTNVEKGKMVSEFEDWCLKEGRKAGDVGIVETQHGYHIMRFVKSSDTTWETNVRNALAASELSEYITALMQSDTVTITKENAKTLENSEKFFIKLIKNSLKNYSQSLMG